MQDELDVRVQVLTAEIDTVVGHKDDVSGILDEIHASRQSVTLARGLNFATSRVNSLIGEKEAAVAGVALLVSLQARNKELQQSLASQ